MFLVLFDVKYPGARNLCRYSAHLVPETPLEDALHTGEAEHQPEEVVDGHGVFGVGQLHNG